ncbi:hypothetical protein N7532_002628 [Penicillium argentinense]|uniref:Uncharacterized protein n=1 Tax=Penicillium argentinense TaxID=1131581 RepID=A0A9W9G111_9EURO|nr:uncharacterized protein N7532_002628 [Penicillium argentinense]KAJ5109983.1 hypothetical protein N7532_002628 [Penicillium argentinense]
MSLPPNALRQTFHSLKGVPRALHTRTPHAPLAALRPLVTYPGPSRQFAPRSCSSPFSSYSTVSSSRNDDKHKEKFYFGSKPLGTPLAMSFESLGIRRNTQLLVIFVLTIGAFLEALLWGEKVWIWWKGEEGDSLD